MASSCCSTALLPFKASDQSQVLPSSSSSIWVSSNNGGCMNRSKKLKTSFSVRAAKLPAGVEMPKVQPKFNPPFAGFTKVAETWNSRACMIGLIGTFIVELILQKGILQMIGVEIGKGLDLPLLAAYAVRG